MKNSKPENGTPEPVPNYEQLEKENKLVLSYLTVRKLIGILGFFFPLILVLGSIIIGSCKEIQDSISNYYHTNMRDVFVGYVCTLSIFMFSYKGYDIADRIVSMLAGIFGVIVALMPTNLKIIRGIIPHCNIWYDVERHSVIGVIHLIAAGLFILSMAYFTLFLFTKGETHPTPEKIIRNLIYKTAGYIMLSCIAILIFFFILPDTVTQSFLKYKPVFWLETIAFVAFGFSWLVKGGLFFKDKI
ncbi:MAG: class 1 isoprenoid biosynthesis enzyme [Bacteroidia bacterium]|nr:class 1 isoprenoid biosynthesis enzyme [Bacteroidia bacterium]